MVDVTLVVSVGVLIGLIVVALIAIYAARYKKVPPDAAMEIGRASCRERG